MSTRSEHTRVRLLPPLSEVLSFFTYAAQSK